MLTDYIANLFDGVEINYLSVIVAALAYFILALVWYSPQVFGNELVKHEVLNRNRMPPLILAYIGELLAAFIMAFVLALVIELANVDDSLSGAKIAFWMWLGFIATTHFSDVLWGRKKFAGYLLNGGLVLVGLLVMGSLIPLIKNYFPDRLF